MGITQLFETFTFSEKSDFSMKRVYFNSVSSATSQKTDMDCREFGLTL